MSYLEKTMNLLSRVSQQRWVTAIRRGFLTMLPIIIVGSLAVLINNFPLPAYQQLMNQLFGADWKVFGANVYQATFGIMSLSLSIATSYYLARDHNQRNANNVSPLAAALVSFSSFLIITQDKEGMLSFDRLGATSMFLAISTSLLASFIFLLLCRKLKMSRIYTDDAEALLPEALNALVPAVCTISLFYFMQRGVNMLTDQDIHTLFYDFLQRPFLTLKQSFSTAILFDFVSHALWFIGIHGNNVLEPVAINVFQEAQALNEAATTLQEMQVFTKPFFDVFVFLGGSGSTLCLTLAIFFSQTHSNTKQLARLAFLPSLFNINEILIYGLPIVLNPFYFVPFLMTPIVLTLISAAAISLGLVPPTIQAAEWTTPIILGGYTATLSWQGSLLQLVNLAVGTAIYLPFVRLAEKQKENESNQVFRKLFDVVQEKVNAIPSRIIDRSDQTGSLARVLAGELSAAIKNDELVLVYQPLTHNSERVIGVESLLRWPHGRFGYVAPPIVIAIAEESDMIDELGYWILEKSCRQLRAWQEAGVCDLTVSVNLSPLQIRSENFSQRVSDIVQRSGIEPRHLKLEVTEAVALDYGGSTREVLNRIQALGIKFAMDDFGMGHSSLLYIRQMPLHSIKIDGSLVRDVESDKHSRDIIASITQLCDTLNIESVAEFVETEQQRDLLIELGVDVFQGYLYSPPLSPDKAYAYIMEKQEKYPPITSTE